MSYQALLFYSDEKTARVLMQVLDELDFSVEPDSEPFAAVKTLMLQRFDLIIVDCDDEQNASLLFKSARNSETNRDAVAVAITTGQAAIAHAFRIGASLILTKPVNVEQMKSTLRTARAALRKAEAQKAAAHPPSRPSLAQAAAVGSDSLATHFQGPVDPTVQESLIPMPPEDAPPPGVALAIAPVFAPEHRPGFKAQDVHEPKALVPEHVELHNASGAAAAAAPAWAPEEDPSALPPTGTAIVPVPVKEGADEADVPALEPKPETKSKSSQEPETKATAAAKTASATATQARFASVGIREKKEEEEHFDPAKSKRNFVIAAVLVLSLAAGGYYAWMRYHPEINLPFLNQPPHSAPAKPAKAPAPAPAAAPAGTTPDASVATPAPANPPAADASTPSNSASPAPSAVTTPAPAKPSGTVLPEDVSQSLITTKVQPVYPEQAKQMRLEGSVHLQISVNQAGNVTDVKVISGNAILVKAAIDAVRQWKYQAYYVKGQPSAIETQATVDFKLP